MRTLVAYFSKSGKTEKAAKVIADAVDGEIYKIRTKKEYPAGFLQTVGELKKEFRTGEKPALEGDLPDVEHYDRILLGFPVWAGSLPPAVIGFLEMLDLKEKDVYPFYTSYGGAPRKAEGVIEAACGANVHDFLNASKPKKLKLDKWLGFKD